MLIIQSTNKSVSKPHYNFYPYKAGTDPGSRYREWVVGDSLYRRWSRCWDQIRAKYL